MRKYSLQEIKNKVESEGLGYCLTSYFSASDIEDLELAALWKIASETMVKIDQLLDEVANE